MLNLMSYCNPTKYLERFFEKYKKGSQKIFAEIYSFLGDEDFESKQEFENKYKSLLSSEENKSKELSSGLILRIKDDFSKLELTDKNSSFIITIDFIKRISILDEETKNLSQKFFVSEVYLFYYYENVKHKEIKYKFKNNSKEVQLCGDFINKIIYNENFEYIIVYSKNKEIYEDIFKILEKEKTLKYITTDDLFNKYRILNFPEIKNEYIDKIELKPVNYNDYCLGYKYLCYNKKIGLSLITQKLLIQLFQSNDKYFYCNIDFLCKETDKEKIRNYLYFYLAFMFSIEEKDNYKNFIEDKIINIINMYKDKELIKKLFTVLYEKFGDFKLYVDNVKTKFQFDVIKDILDSYYFSDPLVLIQINPNTLNSLLTVKFKLITKEERQYTINEINDDFEYYIPICFNNLDYITIKKDYNEKLQPFFDNCDYYSYLYLLKIKYLLNKKGFDLIKIKTIREFLEFLVVNFDNEYVYDIRFRNSFIEEIFNDYYSSYTMRFKNMNNDIFFDISKSEEGINFEKQIIYDIVINNININKIKVKEIYSIDSFSDLKINKNEEYLFIQQKCNAPYYDIGYLYTYNGITILKVCQIGINKDSDDLKKLNKYFLLFDIYYFCQKLKHEKGIEVKKIELCLITTYNAYQENEQFRNKKILSKDRKYPCFNSMKNFCQKNNFIFLLFDIKSSTFFTYNNENKLEKTDLKNNAYQFNVKKIFTKSKYISETKKLKFNFDPKDPKIIAEIELPSNYDISKLNNEFIFNISDGKAIFEQKIIPENNNNKNPNKMNKEYNIQLKNLKKTINNKNDKDSNNDEEHEENHKNIIKPKKKNSSNYEKSEEKEKNIGKKRDRSNMKNENKNKSQKNNKKKNK